MNGGIYGVLDEAIAFGKKLQKDEHDRLMSKKEDVVLEAVTEYAKNPDTYDAAVFTSNLAVYSSEASASFVRCLITRGFSKTSFSTAKNLNCLNL
jgi:hypothetical protein